MIEKELLIVGAGPAGLALSSMLLPKLPLTCISERQQTQVSHSRATGIQPRTLGILNTTGILDTVRREAVTLKGNIIYLDGEQIRAMSFFDPETGEYGLSLDQRRIESLLADKLTERGRSIEWGTVLVGLEDLGHSVRAEVQHENGSVEQWSCRRVVGCDGGRSAVRKLANIAFPGSTYEEQSFVLDVLMHGDLEPGYMHFFVGKDSRLVLVPLNDRGAFKASGALPPGGTGSLEEQFQRLVTVHGLGRLTAEPLTPINSYVMHARIADTFRVENRIFLCGDAAHLFPPNGGQGMNLALEDASELAMALNFFAESEDPTRLAAYSERREVAVKALASVVASKERYSYESLTAGVDFAREQRRIESEEL